MTPDPAQPDEAAHTKDLQRRIDLILSGHVPVERPAEAALEDEDQTPFSVFMPDDLGTATDLASEFISTADEAEGDGLVAAVDAIYASLGFYKPGIVEHATKLFLTHYPQARKRLVIRSLEERQPGLVQPSRQVVTQK